MMHIEADNMVYGRYSALLPALRSGYPGLACTPLTASKFFHTASTFWVGRVAALRTFNDFLLSLGTDQDSAFTHYVAWLRRYACCKAGGVKPDKNGQGVKPYAINEMSMLAYYNKYAFRELKLFPVVPYYPEYVTGRFVCNLSSFAPGGGQVGPDTLGGIWDPNSWGQFAGGTARKKGRDKGFVDGSHIIGQAITTSGCTVSMRCGNQTLLSAADWQAQQSLLFPANASNASQALPAEAATVLTDRCYTAPFARCGIQRLPRHDKEYIAPLPKVRNCDNILTFM